MYKPPLIAASTEIIRALSQVQIKPTPSGKVPQPFHPVPDLRHLPKNTTPHYDSRSFTLEDEPRDILVASLPAK